MTRHCTLIVNPVSGGYSEARLQSIRAALEAGGITSELLLTKSADDAAMFAEEACRQNDEPFIAAGGGDGTINGVINGLEPGKGILAVLPLGTANVLSRELGIRTVEDAVARIIRGVARPMTIGVLRGPGVERRFVLMAGIGLDGRIVENVKYREKRWMGKGAYLLAAAREMRHWDRQRFQVVAEGKRIDCHSAIICNGALYGGAFILAPGADIFAPGLRIVCITGNTRGAYVRFALSVIAGRVRDNADVSFVTAGDFTVSGDRAVQVDGDYCCRGPVRITAEEGFVRLVV